MHGLWIQTIEEIGLVFVQAVIVMGTFLLHRLTKNVEQLIQGHMMSLEYMVNRVSTNPGDTAKRP